MLGESYPHIIYYPCPLHYILFVPSCFPPRKANPVTSFQPKAIDDLLLDLNIVRILHHLSCTAHTPTQDFALDDRGEAMIHPLVTRIDSLRPALIAVIPVLINQLPHKAQALARYRALYPVGFADSDIEAILSATDATCQGTQQQDISNAPVL